MEMKLLIRILLRQPAPTSQRQRRSLEVISKASSEAWRTRLSTCVTDAYLLSYSKHSKHTRSNQRPIKSPLPIASCQQQAQSFLRPRPDLRPTASHLLYDTTLRTTSSLSVSSPHRLSSIGAFLPTTTNYAPSLLLHLSGHKITYTTVHAQSIKYVYL